MRNVGLFFVYLSFSLSFETRKKKTAFLNSACVLLSLRARRINFCTSSSRRKREKEGESEREKEKRLSDDDEEDAAEKEKTIVIINIIKVESGL